MADGRTTDEDVRCWDLKSGEEVGGLEGGEKRSRATIQLFD